MARRVAQQSQLQRDDFQRERISLGDQAFQVNPQ
jgi:hypothetical protein